MAFREMEYRFKPRMRLVEQGYPRIIGVDYGTNDHSVYCEIEVRKDGIETVVLRHGRTQD